MDILDPFTMKNVIIYEKGWKVCLKWDISCSIWMQGRIVWARNRQKWQLGEYEGERGSCNHQRTEEEERSNSLLNWITWEKEDERREREGEREKERRRGFQHLELDHLRKERGERRKGEREKASLLSLFDSSFQHLYIHTIILTTHLSITITHWI